MRVVTTKVQFYVAQEKLTSTTHSPNGLIPQNISKTMNLKSALTPPRLRLKLVAKMILNKKVKLKKKKKGTSKKRSLN